VGSETSGSPDALLKPARRERHITDFTGWKDHDAYRKGFERLMRDLTMQQVPKVP
jgi:hypothetical protein